MECLVEGPGPRVGSCRQYITYLVLRVFHAILQVTYLPLYDYLANILIGLTKQTIGSR